MADQLTSLGLEIDDFQTRLDAFLAEVRSEISSIIDGSADSSEGQFIRIFVDRAQSLAELIQVVHAAQYPDNASGFSLTALSRLTGTERDSATKSTVECRVNVDAGTYGIGTLIAHVDGDPTSRFVNTESVTNPGPGAANVDDVAFEAEETGPVAAPSGTLTVIAEPVTGWNSVTNAAPGGSGDADLGEAEEIDSALRQRRDSELQTGSTAVGAILTALTQIDGVSWADVLENDTDTTDINGLPPHAIEAVVLAPTVSDATLAGAIFAAKAAGIRAHGSSSDVVEDSAGHDHDIGFTRATVVDIYLEIDVDVDDETYAGDTDLETAVVTWGDANLGVGNDVILTQIIHTIIDNVGGVIDVTEIRIGRAPAPVSTSNEIMAWDEIAELDTARITVASTVVS
jgi:uncharacterized phage protein gp47/JayE